MTDQVRRRGGRGWRAAFFMGTTAIVVAGCTITPHPLTDAERTKQADADRTAMFANQEPISGPLTLDQAFARALKYNLDQRVKIMEQAVADNQLDISKFDLLPKLTVDAGYLNRSNQNASSSESIQTQTQSLQPSISENRDSWTADLVGSWNILDFGVSYFTARQQANRALIADEQRRKVIDNLLDEVRASFWRVAGAQTLSPVIARIETEAEQALADSRSVEQQRLREPLEALRYQKTLLDLLRQLDVMRQELDLAKAQLAALINVPPGADFTVAVPPDKDLTVTKVAVSADKMDEAALLHNPDLRVLSYESRITVDDTRKAILRLLPGIDLSYGTYYDSNSFLINPNWRQGAARVTWNLLNVLSAPDIIKEGENSEKVANMRRQAVSMAVLTKLHVAYDDYLFSQKLFQRDTELNDVDTRIYDQTANRVEANAQGKLDRITTEVSLIYSRLRRYQSYAEVEGAVGRIYETMGLDPVPQNIAATDVNSVSQAIAKTMESWRSGAALAQLTAPSAQPPANVAPTSASAPTSGNAPLQPVTAKPLATGPVVAKPEVVAGATPSSAVSTSQPPTAHETVPSPETVGTPASAPIAVASPAPVEVASTPVAPEAPEVPATPIVAVATNVPRGVQVIDAGLETIGRPR